MAKEPTPIQQRDTALEQVEALTGQLTEAKSTIIDLTAKLTTANEAAISANTNLVEVRRQLSEAVAALAKAQGDLALEMEAHNILKTNFDEAVLKLASAKAAQIAASQGIPAIAAKVNEKPTKTEPETKPKDAFESLSAGAAEDLKKIAA